MFHALQSDLGGEGQGFVFRAQTLALGTSKHTGFHRAQQYPNSSIYETRAVTSSQKAPSQNGDIGAPQATVI